MHMHSPRRDHEPREARLNPDLKAVIVGLGEDERYNAVGLFPAVRYSIRVEDLFSLCQELALKARHGCFGIGAKTVSRGTRGAERCLTDGVLLRWN
jgi:hypothetical protein